MFWGKMILLYGILRQVNVSPLLAFMATLLFLVYPVNSGLMSLRSYQMTFSKLALLAAVYLAFDFRENSRSVVFAGNLAGTTL